MKNILEYKGYHTRVEYNSESNTLRGKIEGINDLVDFECDNLGDVEKEFHSAVDDYLILCEQIGVSPDKEYKGTFNIRISPELHKKIAYKAYQDDISLNSEVELAISKYVKSERSEAEIVAQYLRFLDAFSPYKQYVSSPCDYGTTQNLGKIIPLNAWQKLNDTQDRAKEN